jgi:hypothetical protein
LVSVGIGVWDGRRVGGGSGVLLGSGVETFGARVGRISVSAGRRVGDGAALQATKIQAIKIAMDILGRNGFMNVSLYIFFVFGRFLFSDFFQNFHG